MRLLVLGGTRFVGRAFVEEALAAGHEVTLFNRGETRPELFPDLEKIRGDRTSSLEPVTALGRTWDAVFDPSCYVPRVARTSVGALRALAPHYTFISSLSVYDDLSTGGQDEDGRLGTLDDPTTEEVTDESYGPLKVLAEREVQAAYGDLALILRPGYICGPYDSAWRMPYWLDRMARGGEVLAPESPDAPVQLIDARDIARFALALATRSEGGVFNLCAPQEPYRIGRLLEIAAETVGARDVRFTWASADFLLENGLDGWEAFPWWVPPQEIAFSRFDASRALAAGLEVRPIEGSFRDCWAWQRSGEDLLVRADEGLEPEREAELLDAWRARNA
ncbi:MAG TPA: NAD-dependent epimerase/dehydratase family protein [Actinomycetota bacterium]|nr:NAD-dependent epimerase/dehydratase family protein [Actinomycetota bacterium]